MLAIVGERGVTLSGGQKQRVALARALLSERPGLLLDDTISAVDPVTERRILNGLEQERRGRTMLVASHRLSVLTAADLILVLENGRPIGSVGIFTDLREKLRIQAELERAQDELRSREKQALIAELAGAAAHELNQPLMIVGAYAQLLQRQVEADAEAKKTAEVITSEAQRMADIVRKVGSITKYETKSYVGEAKILDLELASAEKGERMLDAAADAVCRLVTNREFWTLPA